MMNFLMFVALIFAQNPDSVKPKPVGEHTLGEEVITGEAEMKITDQKLFFPPQLDPWTPVNDLLAPETYVFDEALLKTIDSLSVPQHFIKSSFLRVPVERTFIYGDLLVFLPKFEKRVASWELIIANSLGETVRRVREQGQPPAVITWDGRNDRGEPVATGDVYSFTFNADDAQGNQTRINCEPQRINAVVWQEKNEWVVSIAADMVFSADGAQLTAEAGARVDEIANLIKQRFKKETVIYIYSEKENLSADRCRVLETELRRRVVFPPDGLKVAPRFIPGLQPKHSRIEIHIF
ncbi:MAG: FlgD immunoglobulin-like domain containing protein [candidate division WOR-3 bacterium]